MILMIAKIHTLPVSKLILGHTINSLRRFESAHIYIYLCIVRHANSLCNPKRSST